MRSKGETQERGCNCGLGCEPGQEPGWGRSKGEDSVAFRRMGGGQDPDYKPKGLRDGKEILEYEGTGLPSPTRTAVEGV